MKKKLYFVGCIVLSLSLMLSACSGGDNADPDKEEDEASVRIIEELKTDETSEDDVVSDDINEEETAEDEDQPEDGSKDEVQPGDIVFTGQESIVFEYYVEDPTGITNMKITMSEGFVRVDIPDIDVVGVINTNDDTGFIYYKSNFGKLSMSFYNLGSVDGLTQLNVLCNNVDEIENLERTTLDGRECIYGETEDDGDVLKLWYSEEHHILLQYIMDSSDGVSTMKVTSIEEFDGDMGVFEMPAGCIDLGTQDAGGEAFTEYTDDLG